MELASPKGMRDMLPEEAIPRQWLRDQLREVFERYGFSPLETPAVERYDVLASKYAGGADILKECFRLKDQGGRELGLRYDLTVPLARVVGTNPNVKLPFKRYQIAPVWRDGPMGMGRYREFWQCDGDIVGAKGMAADAEAIAIASTAFAALGLPATIYVNDRKLMNGLLAALGIIKDREAPILALDKLHKISREELIRELGALGLGRKTVDELLRVFGTEGTNEELLAFAGKLVKDAEGKEGLAELRELLAALAGLGVRNVKVDLALARGLAYYTGPVFETVLADSPIKTSVCSGGRYDAMIGSFAGGKAEYPAVGVSFGMDRIYDALKAAGKLPAGRRSLTEAFIVPIKDPAPALALVQELRSHGIRAETDLMGRNPGKNLEYVNALGIPSALFLGPEEAKQRKVKLRDMATGKEQLLSTADAIKAILAGRK
jgi:histidyl-tRNA synthetase